MTILIVSVSKVDNLDHFLESWFSLLETQTNLSHYTTLMSIAGWDEHRRILQTPTNWVSKHKNQDLSFEKQAFFIFTTWKDFERILRHAKTADGTVNSTCMYKCICKVNKKGPPKGFLSQSLEHWLSIFAWSLTFEQSKLFLYLSRYVFTCFTPGGVKATA